MKIKYIWTRIVSATLAMVMLATTCVQAYAVYEPSEDTQSTSTAVITKDDDKMRIAESYENGYHFIAILDKSSGEITLTKYDSTGSAVYTQTTGGDNSIKINDEIISFGRSQSIYQNTFTNYEYTKWFGTPNTWELRRPKDGFTIDQKDSFQTKETSTNKPYLDDFYDAVERLNTEEQNFLAYTTVEVLIGAIGAMFSGGLVEA